MIKPLSVMSVAVIFRYHERLPESDESRLLCPNADPEQEDPRGTEQQVHRQAHVAKQLVPVGACRGQKTVMIKCAYRSLCFDGRLVGRFLKVQAHMRYQPVISVSVLLLATRSS